jgi:hypothetical protein
MLCIIVVASSECIQPTSEAINWRLESHIVVIGEKDVEAAIK